MRDVGRKKVACPAPREEPCHGACKISPPAAPEGAFKAPCGYAPGIEVSDEVILRHMQEARDDMSKAINILRRRINKA